jgi:transcriptional regulator with GAF, ATPase, and Fis domain
LCIAKICAVMFAQRYSSFLTAKEGERERFKSQTLFGTAESLMAVNDVEIILESVVHKLTMFIQASFAVLFWVDYGNKELVEIVSSSRRNMLIRVPASFRRDTQDKVEKSRLALSTPALSCRVVSSGKRFLIANAQNDHRFNQTFDDYIVEQKRMGVTRSLVGLPLLCKSSERIIGVLVFGKVEDSFSDMDVEHIDDFKDLICISLARLMAMHRKSKALNEEISFIKNLVDSMGSSKDDTSIVDSLLGAGN